MNIAMSVGRKRQNSWACCFSLFFLSWLAILKAPREWIRLTRCFRQWHDICLFGSQSPSINHFSTRHWSSLNLCSPPMQTDIFHRATLVFGSIFADIITDLFFSSCLFSVQYLHHAAWNSWNSVCVSIVFLQEAAKWFRVRIHRETATIQ